MWPWEHVGARPPTEFSTTRPTTGSLCLRAMADGDGSPIVVPEARVLEANELGTDDHRDQRVAHRHGRPRRAARDARSDRIATSASR